MESRREFGRRMGLLCFVFSIFILFHCTIAEDRTEPTANLNLAPFWGWRSAYFCLEHFKNTTSCPLKNLLTEEGVLEVSDSDATEFCKSGGCASQTKAALTCIHYVKRHYWFFNGENITSIENKINNICHSLKG